MLQKKASNSSWVKVLQIILNPGLVSCNIFISIDKCSTYSVEKRYDCEAFLKLYEEALEEFHPMHEGKF